MFRDAMTFAIRCSGERAFFTRPEFCQDRVTYDLITPRIARGLFDAIHWRPSIRWTVTRIYISSIGIGEALKGDMAAVLVEL
nr:CRISPR-associated protein Cas5 [Sphingomonas guangdongensis]